jgi:hypothetical protein
MIRLFIILICFSFCFSFFIFSDEFPEWMQNQIDRDCQYYKDKTISLSKMEQYFREHVHDSLLIKITIHNHQITIEGDSSHLIYQIRVPPIYHALLNVSNMFSLPDTIFLMCIGDAMVADSQDLPVFSMAKCKDHRGDQYLLFPDYECLAAKYQVVSNVDITKQNFPWKKKDAKLIWRGSTAQYSFCRDENIITVENYMCFSRLKLCLLSTVYPDLIDAKFTQFVQGAENIPMLQNFRGAWMSFEEQINHKYHIFIDGNATAYSHSGWKFFVNSLIFKPESKWIQWYHADWRPYIHYIPVKMDLEDLIDKLEWAKKHDKQAKRIANNMRKYARKRINPEANLLYLYLLINAYSQLNFVD